MALTEEEFGWIQRFLKIKDKLPGGVDAKFLFFTSSPNPCKNLNNYFQDAWKSMGLPGCPTFTDVWTFIVSHLDTEDPGRTSQGGEVEGAAEGGAEGAKEGAVEGGTGDEGGVAPDSSTPPKEVLMPSSPGSTELGQSSQSGMPGPAEGRAEGASEGGDTEFSHPRKRYPKRQKFQRQLTPVKSALGCKIGHKNLSPLKLKKGVLSTVSTTLMGMHRQKKASKTVKKAIESFRKRK
ncbi:hypothetical protein QQF64_033840 [Cirrhinus molitorella]|uniref:Uncharacterized protein n=1 Tax=Cirrhinus molitorella TaxID=172907 RepID=A0ABR3MV48_9TELE